MRLKMCCTACRLPLTLCAASLKKCARLRAGFIRCVRGRVTAKLGSVVYCLEGEAPFDSIVGAGSVDE